jgi:hypothetical protein
VARGAAFPRTVASDRLQFRNRTEPHVYICCSAVSERNAAAGGSGTGDAGRGIGNAPGDADIHTSPDGYCYCYRYPFPVADPVAYRHTVAYADPDTAAAAPHQRRLLYTALLGARF